jgi:oligosaccharide repeat unit polymerase
VTQYHIFAISILALFFSYQFFLARYKFTSSSFLTFLYLCSLLGSAILDSRIAVEEYQYSWRATLYFVLVLILYLLPFLLLRPERFFYIRTPNWSVFYFVSYALIAFGFVVWIESLPRIATILGKLNLGLAGLRGMAVAGQLNASQGIPVVINFFAQFYPITILFYFHSSVYRPEKTIVNKALLVSSLCYPMLVFAAIGRDGVVLWSLSFLFTALLYRNFLDDNLWRNIKRLGLFFIVTFGAVIVAISLSRFLRDGDVVLLLHFILAYLAQQFGEFNQYFNNVNVSGDRWGDVFPLLKFFGLESVKNAGYGSAIDADRAFEQVYGFNAYVFKTFIGQIYSYLGVFNGVLGALFFLIFFGISFVADRRRTPNLGTVLLYVLAAQILLHGVFYYKLAYTVSNLYMLTVLMLSFFLRFR